MPTNAGGLVYGTILVAALLSAESARRETYLDTVLAVLATLVAYWLTVTYAELAGHRAEHAGSLTPASIGRVAVRESALLLGAMIPLLVLLGCWVAGVALSPAVAAAAFTAAGTVVVTEVGIAVRADLRGRELVGQALLGAGLGLLVIAVRLLLH